MVPLFLHPPNKLSTSLLVFNSPTTQGLFFPFQPQLYFPSPALFFLHGPNPIPPRFKNATLLLLVRDEQIPAIIVDNVLGREEGMELPSFSTLSGSISYYFKSIRAVIQGVSILNSVIRKEELRYGCLCGRSK